MIEVPPKSTAVSTEPPKIRSLLGSRETVKQESAPVLPACCHQFKYPVVLKLATKMSFKPLDTTVFRPSVRLFLKLPAIYTLAFASIAKLLAASLPVPPIDFTHNGEPALESLATIASFSPLLAIGSNPNVALFLAIPAT